MEFCFLSFGVSQEACERGDTQRTLASITRFKWYAGKSTCLVASYRAKATGWFGGVPYEFDISSVTPDEENIQIPSQRT